MPKRHGNNPQAHLEERHPQTSRQYDPSRPNVIDPKPYQLTQQGERRRFLVTRLVHQFRQGTKWVESDEGTKVKVEDASLEFEERVFDIRALNGPEAASIADGFKLSIEQQLGWV